MKTKGNTTLQPTVEVLRSEQRGAADHGWLKAKHSFSFANYYNPQRMGFRSLRVINQDVIAAGGGFPTHPHRNMEIFTYMLSGSLAHKDSMGNVVEILPGQIQLMSAGSGITHSEFNPSSEHSAELLQIWIEPREVNLTPSYTEWAPTDEQRQLKKSLIISPDGSEHSAIIHQDAFIYKVQLKAGESISHKLAEGRGVWFQLISGSVRINQHDLQAGDAAFSENAGEFSIAARENAEVLLFDLG